MGKHNFDDAVIRPLQVPAAYDPDASMQDRTVFALAELGEAEAEEVAAKLNELGDHAATDRIKDILDRLYEKGLVNGTPDSSNRRYNLAKETRPHHGRVHD